MHNLGLLALMRDSALAILRLDLKKRLPDKIFRKNDESHQILSPSY